MERTEQLAFAPGLEGLDQHISLWMNGINAPWSDAFWAFMSLIKVWYPMYALVAALLIWRLGWKRGLICIACAAVGLFLDERICNLIKETVERVRPCNDSGMIAAGIHILEHGGGWSCPSGHACNSFGFAITTALCLKMDRRLNWTWYSIFILTWAALVGISRVMVARHFLGDVLIGTAIGLTVGYLMAILAGVLCRKVQKKQ